MPGQRQNKKLRKTREETPWADPDEGVIYAVITGRSGGNFVDALCSDGIKRKIYLRNKFKKKIWLNQGDVVLVSKRTDLSGDNKVDIIHKYFPDEKIVLVTRGDLKFARSVTDAEFDADAKSANSAQPNYDVPPSDDEDDVIEKPRRQRTAKPAAVSEDSGDAESGDTKSEDTESGDTESEDIESEDTESEDAEPGNEDEEEVVTYDNLGNIMVNGKYATDEQVARIQASQTVDDEDSDSDEFFVNTNVRGQKLEEPHKDDEASEEVERNLHTKVASEETDSDSNAEESQWRSGDKKKKTKTVDPMKRKQKKGFKNNRRK